MAQNIQSPFCTITPSNQTAVDIFKGLWKSRFPNESGIQAGNVPNFDDGRVTWVAKRFGDLGERSILELGPFEAYHTWQFSRLGATPITAVEGNSINYLKCLIAKEVLDIDARFLHGDIGNFLDNTSERYDLCWACGVLYHQVEPMLLLKQITRVSRCVFFWTHFFDAKIADSPGKYPNFNADRNVEKCLDGYCCTHYYRSYRHKDGMPEFFSGGSEPFAYWLSKDDILGYLATLDFTDIIVRGIDREHKAGPTLSFLAMRSNKENEIQK